MLAYSATFRAVRKNDPIRGSLLISSVSTIHSAGQFEAMIAVVIPSEVPISKHLRGLRMHASVARTVCSANDPVSTSVEIKGRVIWTFSRPANICSGRMLGSLHVSKNRIQLIRLAVRNIRAV